MFQLSAQIHLRSAKVRSVTLFPFLCTQCAHLQDALTNLQKLLNYFSFLINGKNGLTLGLLDSFIVTFSLKIGTVNFESEKLTPFQSCTSNMTGDLKPKFLAGRE